MTANHIMKKYDWLSNKNLPQLHNSTPYFSLTHNLLYAIDFHVKIPYIPAYHTNSSH